MAGKRNDAVIIAALVSGATVDEAAKSAGISPRTVHRRLCSPEFKAALDDANFEVIRHAVSRLSGASLRAVDTLEDLLEADSENVRLQAVRTIFQLPINFRETIDHEDRLRQIEIKIKQAKLLNDSEYVQNYKNQD